MRLWIVVASCVLRLALTRYHLQAYLDLAQKWVEQMKREAGRIAAIDIQRKVGGGFKCGEAPVGAGEEPLLFSRSRASSAT